LQLHWGWLPLVLPLLFITALAFATVGLYFTAILPSIDHMSLPFFLFILPMGFASSTYFPIPDIPFLATIVQLNPLHQLSEGLRALLLNGQITGHLSAAAGLCVMLLVFLVPLDMRLLRRRVFGDR
jgi:lipooligosaccharide transport system permease protein